MYGRRRIGKSTLLQRVTVARGGFYWEADPDRSGGPPGPCGRGPGGRQANPGQARLLLCGSALAMMRSLTVGQAPLRGRAGLELVMQPFGYRASSRLQGLDHSLALAVRVHAVIGGVSGYATDLVDHDLPADPGDFDRWVAPGPWPIGFAGRCRTWILPGSASSPQDS